MASYGSTAAASEPLVAKPQGASLKGLIAGAAGASFVLGALAATAITVQTQTALYSPLYEFEQISEEMMSFDECKAACEDAGLFIPCITSFDMNDQLRTDLKKSGLAYAWVGHKSTGGEGVWVYEECENRQKNQFKGDFINRNAGAFEAAFDDAEGCAVVVNGLSEAGASSLGLGSNPAYGGPGPNLQHQNYVKDSTCEGSDEEGGVACFCQTIKGATVPEPTPEATDDAPATPTDDAPATPTDDAAAPAEPATTDDAAAPAEPATTDDAAAPAEPAATDDAAAPAEPATATDDAAAPAEPATDDAAAPAEPATATDDATGASPEIEVGAAQTLPAEVRRKLKFGARRLSEDAEVRRKLKFGARRLSEDN